MSNVKYPNLFLQASGSEANFIALLITKPPQNLCNGSCNEFCYFSAIEKTRENEAGQNWQDFVFNFQRSKKSREYETVLF